LGPQAQKAESGRGQDDPGHVEGQADNYRRDAQRHDMAIENAQGRGALQPRGHDVLAVADGDGLGTGQARIGRPGGQRDGEHRVFDSGAERRDEGERQDQPRECQEDVGEAHQNVVDPAADIAGHRADQDADGHHQDADQPDDVKRDPRAPDDALVDVPAQLVGAEPMLGARRQQAVGEMLLGPVSLGQERRQGGDQHQGRDDQQPDHGDRIGAERAPVQVVPLTAGV
jgi:hypothetical protein